MNVPNFHEIMTVMDSWISLNLHVHGSTAEAYGGSACPWGMRPHSTPHCVESVRGDVVLTLSEMP